MTSGPEISETGHTVRDMMDLGNKRALCGARSRALVAHALPQNMANTQSALGRPW